MTCPDLYEHLDAHLDGDLPPEQALALEAHAADCAACRAELALASRLQQALRQPPAAACPDDVFDAALAQIASLERDRAPLPRRAKRLVPRWRLAAGAAVVLGALAIGTLQLLPGTTEPAYSAEEIAEARRQVELAFVLVSEAGRDASLYLHDNVLGPKVITPMRRGLSAE